MIAPLPSASILSRIAATSIACLVVGLTLSAADETNSPASLPDASSEGVGTIIEKYRAGIESAEAKRRAAATKALSRYLMDMNAMMAEKKKARNVTGIAVATTGIDLFQTGITNVEAGGTFQPPEKVRRELDAAVSECKNSIAIFDKTASEEKDKAFNEAMAAFTTVATRGASPARDEAALKKRLLELLQGPVPQPRKDESPTGKTKTATSNQVDVATNLPAILASSGDADTWYPIASWRGSMMGMDIVTIPLSGATQGTNRTTQFNPMSGQSSELTWVVHHSITPSPAMQYRLKRAEKRDGVDLLEWPSAANGFKLTIRAPATERYPSLHGFDLEVALPGSPGAPFGNIRPSQTSDKPAKPHVIALITSPEGAIVYLNGSIYPRVRTPCRLPVPPDTRSLALALPGYAPFIMTNTTFSNGQTIRWNFAPDPRIQRATFPASANATSWHDTGITINAGDSVGISANGQWTCGAGKEPCDASGYPNNQSFYRYYMDSTSAPRLTASANYGALVMRIGEKGRIQPVPSMRFSAVDSGKLFLSINEAQTDNLRSDNTGTLMVSAVVIPAQPLLPEIK